MDLEEHPLRRRYARELGLGIAVALLVAWLAFALGRAGSPEKEGPLAAPAEPRREPVPAEAERPNLPPLRVRVVDGRGAPVGGVAVDLLLVLDDAPELERPCASGETDAASGEVELAREVEFRWEKPVLHRRLRVRALFAEVLRVDLGREFPAETVTVTLPDFGALEARLPADSPEATLDVTTPALADELVLPLRAPFVAGRARLPVAGVGVELRVRARAVGRAAGEFVTVPGPRRARETVSVALALGAPLPEVTLVAVDERGQPIVDALFYASFAGVLLPDPGEARSDASGRLRFWIHEAWRPELTRTFVLRQMPARATPPRPLEDWTTRELEPLLAVPEATVELPVALDARAPTDLGRVVVSLPASVAPTER